ncbi:PTS sugar transporter subunit IIB [Sodalis-like endosymbiont of Proechinophthirus fluctus]|uniref:PTS sugar transporter subunit IIB n=1 Tax=Sodalis-like endosymbiont of Proechinophthirus fluctus TaxID=1462730 RepID=UPI0021100FC0|nr:PTS sugar transporter subunit IIB [Sodalis-like endosymbiont of Proechinophthirus fluctus]
MELVQVYFHLIHGQVITNWRNIISETMIIIMDEKLSKDPFFADICVMTSLLDVDINIMAKEQFINTSQEGYFSTNKRNVLVLFKSIDNVRHLIVKVILFKKVQVGGLSGGVNHCRMLKEISIDNQDLQDI